MAFLFMTRAKVTGDPETWAQEIECRPEFHRPPVPAIHSPWATWLVTRQLSDQPLYLSGLDLGKRGGDNAGLPINKNMETRRIYYIFSSDTHVSLEPSVLRHSVLWFPSRLEYYDFLRHEKRSEANHDHDFFRIPLRSDDVLAF